MPPDLAAAKLWIYLPRYLVTIPSRCLQSCHEAARNSFPKPLLPDLLRISATAETTPPRPPAHCPGAVRCRRPNPGAPSDDAMDSRPHKVDAPSEAAGGAVAPASADIEVEVTRPRNDKPGYRRVVLPNAWSASSSGTPTPTRRQHR